MLSLSHLFSTRVRSLHYHMWLFRLMLRTELWTSCLCGKHCIDNAISTFLTSRFLYRKFA